MSLPTDVRIVEAVCELQPVAFRAPLKFGGRIVDKTFLIDMQVTVETRQGHMAHGLGSMPVGNIWAWPTDNLTADQTEKVMTAFADEVVDLANNYPEYGHPIDLSYHLSGEYFHLARTLPKRLGLDETMPELALLVAASH
jgi:hypothetical protein